MLVPMVHLFGISNGPQIVFGHHAYAEHEWLPSVLGSWQPLLQSLGCPTSPGFLQWNSTFFNSSFSRSEPFKTSLRSASVNPVWLVSMMERTRQVPRWYLTFVLDQDIGAIVKARCAGLRGDTSCGQSAHGENDGGELHDESKYCFTCNAMRELGVSEFWKSGASII